MPAVFYMFKYKNTFVFANNQIWLSLLQTSFSLFRNIFQKDYLSERYFDVLFLMSVVL